MTAGNNGASKPEDDDPFGYLYADGQAAGAQPPGQSGYGYPGPAAQPGVPRTSYNQVRTVGERQYGQQQVPSQPGQGGGYGYPPQQGYGQPPAPQYHQPNPQYAAPETYPGGAPAAHHGSVSGGGSGGRGGGPNTKALLIAAVAVVAVVLVGIGAALLSGSDGDKDEKNNEAVSTEGPADKVDESGQPEKKPDEEPKPPVELPKQDAATLTLGGSTITDKSVKGAEGVGGSYVSGFNQVGSSVTWKAKMPTEGSYRLTVRYAIPAVDANATLTVNGKPNSQPIGLKNFISSSDPNLEKNWQTTWAPVDLQKGENEIKISCEEGNQCDVLLDWLEVTQK
ncbi:CBM35 domain-containing protein [Streptomyces sp. bgisy029]|uniref:CBM35 domain-containing protein n=1 Tax=Streptomyces sp. bgisy029 TaxID=3413771 RepID=UPI003D72ADE2